jgi:hypothetical protein
MRARTLLAILLAFAVLAALSASVAESHRAPAAVPPSGSARPSPAAFKVPPWLLDEVSRPLPSYPPETEAVVLLDEQTTVVSPKGTWLTTCRRAVKVLRPSGVGAARSLVRAGAFDIKVRSMTGWVVNPSGEPRQVTMKQAIFSSLAPDTLYMDAKIIMLIVPEVDVGSVVGFEWEEEFTSPSLEDRCAFQGQFPVLLARYSLSLPPRWASEFYWVNWTPVEPKQDPSAIQTQTFEIANVPAIVDEPFKPKDGALAGRLVVRLRSPEKDARSFAGWPDMGAWYDRLSQDRSVPDVSVSQKAGALTASAPDTLAKIRVLADFVQKEIRYVSIQIGIGGFQPHSASSVLANRYGDCKDKATLLSAMLRAIGVESYYIIVHTDRGLVNMESPVSLYSFNHAILAIRLPDDVPDAGLDGLVRNLRLGRLLVFDPTMPTTPLGRLPFYLQDNTALLAAGGSGELIRLPRPGPESNLLDRKGRLVLTRDGALDGEIQETRRGSLADSLRYQMQTSSETDRRKYLETFLSRSLASFSLKDFEFRNLDSAQDDLLVIYRFIAPSYAKRAGSFLVVRPRVLGHKAVDLTSREKKPRRYPIDLETTTLERDEFVLELPDDFTPEGMPEPLEIDAGFATYKSLTEANGRTLVFRREYRLLEPILPPSRFDEALKFFLAVGAAEQQSVLLKTAASRRP